MPALLSPALRQSLDNTFAQDWERQRRTAEDILRRLQVQEGVVLADQVGMGKTYVALAVAASEILRRPDLAQVVVFVPARVAEKWVNEWGKFHEALLVDAPEIRCVRQAIRSGEDFLKALDDPPESRNHLVIVTYQALTATLKDGFIQLALLYYATRDRPEAPKMRARIAKWSTGSDGLIRDPRFTPDKVERLLDTPPDRWRALWRRITSEDLGDDPVPAHLRKAVQHLDLDDIWSVVQDLPAQRSPRLKARLKTARAELNDVTQAVWKQVLVQASPRLPLLIVDEAHALKNDKTRISRLFTPLPGEAEDGALRGIFERMLFLTATPFELGHRELISILRRLDAVLPMQSPPIEPLDVRLNRLKEALRVAQETAISLDQSWSRLGAGDLATFDRWSIHAEPDFEASPQARRAWRDAAISARARLAMHQQLRPWVIRHQRVHRRDYLSGLAILPGKEAQAGAGLGIPDAAVMPFLLAARAQAIASDDRSGAARPLFAYGIASSYEAFMRLDVGERAVDTDTDADADAGADVDAGGNADSEAKAGVDADSEADAVGDAVPGAAAAAGSVRQATNGAPTAPAQWYHNEIAAVLGSESQRGEHPKIAATVERATALWRSGEKCLIFCWYIRTTNAIQHALQERLDTLVKSIGAQALGVSSEVDDELDRISNRLLKSDSANYERIRTDLRRAFLDATGGNDILAEALTGVAMRNLRTPASLVRYVNLSPDVDVEQLLRGIRGENTRGVNLLDRWTGFAKRMTAMTSDERTKVLARLQGEHSGTDDEAAGSGGRGASLAQVRRAYGGTRREDRERLISVFNTPFAPDILVASSVMGEGIDLHQECRHVIHHDLDWNPSRLEQRTGRLDRIGALAERQRRNIQVYEPYLAGTHDEKMFRVVKDRAGWFDIVMGRAVGTDEHGTDVEEARVPLHDRISRALEMDLRSPS